ncbi:MAG: type I restriction enzyme HsdR N-terminal domain-containing protein [Bacteroidetes bacterium]|nr:MAG: type I restriction enzyme HsdR N-terminal domain-containing protein [Bacteroidota bacterium]
MQKLNLPSFDYKLSKKQEKIYIFDVIRAKNICLFPEEWVRQHFIHFLLNNQYPKTLFQVEKGLKYHSLSKRSDILVYDRQLKPFLLVECKAPNIPIGTQTMEQALTYNSQIQAKYIILSNGIEHFIWQNHSEFGFQILEILPIFPE